MLNPKKKKKKNSDLAAIASAKLPVGSSIAPGSFMKLPDIDLAHQERDLPPTHKIASSL